MNGTKLLAAAIAALVLVGGAATVGAAQTDVSNTDNGADALDDSTETPENASENADNEDRPDAVGPADGLPDVVPDHVNEIHDTIESFHAGSIDHLGNALSDLLSADGADEADEPEETEDDRSAADDDNAADDENAADDDRGPNDNAADQAHDG